MKKKIPIILIGLLLVLKSLDWVLLEKLYFKFPNETEWDSSPWYNFLDHRKIIEFSEDEIGVIGVGSSVALYSLLPEFINQNNSDYRFELYSHVAMAPTDLHYYLDDIISKKPKLVVYVFNPADFQMEYLKKTDNGLEYDYDEWLRHFSWRHPARLIYPNEFAWDYFRDLKKNEIFRLLGKGFLTINRYREFFWDPINVYIERHYRKGRSYHIYTGSVPEEGIWQHGWTKKEFTILCDSTQGIWKDQIFVPNPNTDIQVRYDNGDVVNLNYPKSGWQDIEFNFPKQKDHPCDGLNEENCKNYSPKRIRPIQISISKTFSSRLAENKPYGKEYYYGIRLSQNFCTDERLKDISYKRPFFLEETRFREMSHEEYRKDYHERMVRDNDKRPELARMKALAEAKELVSEEKFKPWIEIERFSTIQKRLNSAGIPLVLVLSPENPLELNKYQDSPWYFGMLEYFGDLSEGHFFDYSNYLKDERFFSDPHHLTYEGSMQFSEKIREIILLEIQDPDSGSVE